MQNFLLVNYTVLIKQGLVVSVSYHRLLTWASRCILAGRVSSRVRLCLKFQGKTSLTALLSKQVTKFRTRLAAAERANLSIHAKIIYFNTFSLSLFYYSQTHRYFAPSLLQPLYHAMANFLLRRHWFPQRLVGLCRWLKIGPLLDPAVMQAVSLFGCYLRQGHTSFANETRRLECKTSPPVLELLANATPCWERSPPSSDLESNPTSESLQATVSKQMAVARLLENIALTLGPIGFTGMDGP